ncbi:MAG: 2-oxo acid dehydrogenase subunit E2 [Verrucomicrobiaceae bacterium]|nr:2-oxo acid dehydrogenase subunit E2 [Verrucomicrobiaceae bacterium]
MPNFVQMPKLSDTMTEGTLLKWLVKVGDKVDVGDPLAEVETDKASMEMVAFDEGTVGAIYVAEGTKMALGETLAVLLDEGESAPDQPPSSSSALDAEAEEEEPVPTQQTAPAVVEHTTPANTGRVKASPLARKIASAENIDLATIAGSGPGGRIVKADLQGVPAETALKAPSGEKDTKAPAPLSAGPVTGGDQRIVLSSMRSIIAERLLASKTQIPHFYLHVELDAEPLMVLLKQANIAAGETTNKLTINDVVLKAAAIAAAAEPRVNASFDGDAIIQFAEVNLSVAIALDDGLVTPVIRGAQNKSLLEISIAVKDLAKRAREKKLSPDEFSGGTLTVSNLGAYGVNSFDAIINPPQAVILSVGGIVKKPVVDDEGKIVPGMRMDVGISCDHRVVDGAVGASYLAELKKRIENPASILL